eukprot:2930068-Prymnesium_polylepis.2
MRTGEACEQQQQAAATAPLAMDGRYSCMKARFTGATCPTIESCTPDSALRRIKSQVLEEEAAY